MRVALLGDIAFIGKMSIKNNPISENYFTEVGEYLSNFDYVIANLETPFSKFKKINGAKSAYICSDVENVHILKKLHIDAVCLANNHMFDYGIEGYETTKSLLSDYGIEFFGTEGREVFVERDNNKIGISGFCCYSSNPLCCVHNGITGVNAYNVEEVCNVLKRNVKNGYLSIISVHAGLEHVNYPSLAHIKAARYLADVSPYVYYGHHPHVIQGVEEYKGSIIAHSLGNFCFDDVYSDCSSTPLVSLNENNRTGVILELNICDNQIVDWKEQIIYISKDGYIELRGELFDVEECNNSLKNSENNIKEYIEKRNCILSARISERKSARNFTWYFKRLRPRYFQILLNNRKNNKKFKQNVLRYIE